MTKQIIIGYSGHAYVVMDAAIKAGLQVVGYAERKEQTDNPFKLDYIGFENNENFAGWNRGYEFILGIGDNKIRNTITKLLEDKKEKVRTVIHPSATVGSHVEIGKGTFIAPAAVINPFVEIDEATIINTGAIVEHDSKIGKCSHVAPGAVLAGNVKIGNQSFIGANAVIKEGVEIGDDVVIGAGSVILSNVKSGTTVAGNPGREL